MLIRRLLRLKQKSHTLENYFRIEHGTIVLKGVHIGNGSKATARTVLTKNIESYAIVGRQSSQANQLSQVGFQ